MNHVFKLKHNKKIIDDFSLIVKKLNAIGITPIIYGSLGLCLLIGEHGRIADIDMLLTNTDFRRHWKKIKECLIKEMGYKNDPDHAQELIGKTPYISFLKLSDVKKLTPIRPGQLTKYSLKKGIYYNLALPQYLDIYQGGLLGLDRKRKKERLDNKKIRLIKRCLSIKI
jgi:hypothetical protein